MQVKSDCNVGAWMSRLAVATAFAVGLGGAAVRGAGFVRPVAHQAVVQKLVEMLDARPDLRSDLTAAISRAGLAGIPDIDGFLAYCDEVATWIPRERELVPKLLPLYFVVNQAPEDRLNSDAKFIAWQQELVRAMGRFLDTPASASGIESFTAEPSYHADDYLRGPSGWQTFNQFFAREIRSGKRPVAAPCDDRVIVSPADSVFKGQWPIESDSTITVKGVKWSIPQLLAGSRFANAFTRGTYAHAFLNVNDYHRYHMPVGGVVREVRNIHGRYSLAAVRTDSGDLDVRAGDTFQFNQERGLVVVESPVLGLVAILPVGMGHISSVTLTPAVGAELRKGEEFGYFAFGGSDIVLLFENRGVKLDATVGQKYLQGERIGSVDPIPR
ncbi:MAG: phosphatidylserine decarboxylase [Thermoanaerobaculia bacterium]